MNAASCQALANRRLNVDDACSDAIRGTVAEGGACTGAISNECLDGFVCLGDTCPKTCQTPAVPETCIERGCPTGYYCGLEQVNAATGTCRASAALGEACGASNSPESSCVGDLVCAYSSANSRFECEVRTSPAAGLGEDCSSFDACAEPLHCDLTGTHTCTARAALGEPCFLDAASCEPGLSCHVPDGGACSESTACEGTTIQNCCAGESGSVCLARAAACNPPGTCIAPAGSPSTPHADLPIAAAGEDCANKVCALGSTCTCESSTCDARTCAPLVEDGVACLHIISQNSDPLVCAHGRCDIFADRCVVPGAPGSSCTAEGLDLTCSTGICHAGACSSTISVCQ